jgi:predicted kinase
MEAVILVGAQASGKSTFFQDRFRDTHVRINLDMLRTRHRESILLRACLEMKQPFVVDNTNPTPEDRARYIPAAREARFNVVGYYFQSRINDLLSRNQERPEHQQVPDVAICGTHRRLSPPSLSEGFDRLYYVRASAGGGFVVEEEPE